LIRLQCATGNAGKLREFRLAAGLAPVEIELLPGYREIPPCVEDGRTFEENAAIKALHYGAHASGLLFADDSGLEVDALGGAPGVFSARFSLRHPPVAGPPLPIDQANNRLLIEKMRGVENRTARFVCAIALAEGGRHGGKVRGVWRGAVEGIILDEPRGAGGFGYDPLFFCPDLGCTFGEAGEDRKFTVSHRGQALRAMLAALRGQHGQSIE
jgi:XTP/dITP diphosphohydrolase